MYRYWTVCNDSTERMDRLESLEEKFIRMMDKLEKKLIDRLDVNEDKLEILIHRLDNPILS